MAIPAASDTTMLEASELISRDVQRPMEDTQDVDVAVVLDEVRDSVMPLEKYLDMAL